MRIITLTTDWNQSDFYIASVKGRILSSCTDVTIIDISHQIQTFNNMQAAFVVRNSFRHFPEGTIHIIAVNSMADKEKPLVLVKALGHYFITCDNGIFGLLLDGAPEKIVRLDKGEGQGSAFVALDVFCRVACDLVKGKKPEDLGTATGSFNKSIPVLPAIDESVINGSVIYIDSYRNAITNVTRELFEKIGKKRPFDIFVQSNHYKINKLNSSYNETSAGEILALFNSADLLEIAINNGNAADLLNLGVNSVIRIKFHDKK
jgi:S-adenosylmethionine hydrolase